MYLFHGLHLFMCCAVNVCQTREGNFLDVQVNLHCGTLAPTTQPTSSPVRALAPIRLANGTFPFSGRVEVFHNGTWGTVCNTGWSYYDCSVVCRQLNMGSARYPIWSFGGGSDPIWMSNVGCFGSEPYLTRCFFDGWGSHQCSHSQDVGCACTGPPTTASPTPAPTVRAVVVNSTEKTRLCLFDFAKAFEPLYKSGCKRKTKGTPKKHW